MLRSLLAQGAQPVGALDQCHAVAIDARVPKNMMVVQRWCH